MADLNTVYAGVVEYFDPHADSGIPNPSTWNWFGGGGSNFWINETPMWPELEAINTASSSTIAAVKVPFVTGQDRTQWLNDRLISINNRVSFIKGRVTQILNTLQASGSSSYDVIMKGYTAALSLVPVVGTVVNYFAGKSATAQAVEQAKLQSLGQSYTADLEQLSQIRAQLIKEFAVANPEESKKYEAPTVIPIWWYFVGAAILLLLIILIRSRNKKYYN